MLGQRLCVPGVIELKKEIMEEAHSSAYAMHPGSTKMYRTLKDHYCNTPSRESVQYMIL